jgi:putative membrane protein
VSPSPSSRYDLVRLKSDSQRIDTQIEGGKVVIEALVGLPSFIVYFGIGVVLVALYLALYSMATAHNEFALIRQNVLSASVALGFSLVGFALPLASAIVHAQSIFDSVVWGIVALAVQIVVYFLVRLVIPDLSQRIEAGEMAAALFLGACSLTGGIVNAAAMTY